MYLQFFNDMFSFKWVEVEDFDYSNISEFMYRCMGVFLLFHYNDVQIMISCKE